MINLLEYFSEEVLSTELFKDIQLPWEPLKRLNNFLLNTDLGKRLGIIMPGAYVDPDVGLEDGVIIEPGACVFGPTLIGKGTVIRAGAYIRGDVIIGQNCVIGHSCELKHTIILDKVKMSHLNYVGDSILANGSHLAGGSIVANSKLLGGTVKVKTLEGEMDTGLKKFGAIIGEKVEVGCGTVINPGTLLGKGSVIYPLQSVRGLIPNNIIYKSKNEQIAKN